MQACQLKQTLSTLDSNHAAREEKDKCTISVRKHVVYDIYVYLESIGNSSVQCWNEKTETYLIVKDVVSAYSTSYILLFRKPLVDKHVIIPTWHKISFSVH